MKAKLYEEDFELFEHLGLQKFAGIPTHEKYFVGRVVRPEYEVEVFVECWPAKFWTFIIHDSDTHSEKEISTGSGNMSKFWHSVELIASGMLCVN